MSGQLMDKTTGRGKIARRINCRWNSLFELLALTCVLSSLQIGFLSLWPLFDCMTWNLDCVYTLTTSTWLSWYGTYAQNFQSGGHEFSRHTLWRDRCLFFLWAEVWVGLPLSRARYADHVQTSPYPCNTGLRFKIWLILWVLQTVSNNWSYENIQPPDHLLNWF